MLKTVDKKLLYTFVKVETNDTFFKDSLMNRKFKRTAFILNRK